MLKVLTASEMREVDRRTMETGIPEIVLMENAGHRVVEFLAGQFAPLSSQRIVIVCGKGNNGGDAMVVARQLFTRFRPKSLDVILMGEPSRTLTACGCPVAREFRPNMRSATLVIDGILGTGINGPAKGPGLEAIRRINSEFPDAKIVAIDIPSGMPSDSGNPAGESVRADYTVTFTAPKRAQVLPPNCNSVGVLRVAQIGSPPSLHEQNDSIYLSLIERGDFRQLLAPRHPDTNKGNFGHVLVIGGSWGKTGAPAMAGLAALRSGAGLVTVACPEAALAVVASYAPELMTEPLSGNDLQRIVARKDVLAIGPGLGTHPDTVSFVRRAVLELPHPMVIDADGLNALAGEPWSGEGKSRVLTPHPGEMARLSGLSVQQIQADRVETARAFATERKVTLVLKGQCTVIAFADGRVWLNPTGTPALATGGTGDILTGMIAGFLGQFPDEPDRAVAAAVYLHGLSGRLGAAELSDKSLIATDILRYLPAAMEQCASLPDEF